MRVATPNVAQTSIGVEPLASRWFTSAPRSIKRATTTAWPAPAARVAPPAGSEAEPPDDRRRGDERSPWAPLQTKRYVARRANIFFLLLPNSRIRVKRADVLLRSRFFGPRGTHARSHLNRRRALRVSLIDVAAAENEVLHHARASLNRGRVKRIAGHRVDLLAPRRSRSGAAVVGRGLRSGRDGDRGRGEQHQAPRHERQRQLTSKCLESEARLRQRAEQFLKVTRPDEPRGDR